MGVSSFGFLIHCYADKQMNLPIRATLGRALMTLKLKFFLIIIDSAKKYIINILNRQLLYQNEPN